MMKRKPSSQGIRQAQVSNSKDMKLRQATSEGVIAAGDLVLLQRFVRDNISAVQAIDPKMTEKELMSRMVQVLKTRTAGIREVFLMALNSYYADNK